MSDKKPNIIYILSDQHRHDAMGCAGNPVIRTPHLDTLAKRGVRFTRAYSQCPICQPARASIITGRYLHQHGIAMNFKKNLDPQWPTMMKQLQRAGYTTAVTGKTHYYTDPEIVGADDKGDDFGAVDTSRQHDLRIHQDFVKSFGFDTVMEEFDRYFHVYRHIHTPYTEYLKSKGRLEAYRNQIASIWRLTENHWNGVTSVLPQEDDLTSFIADNAVEWLKNYDDDKPFFLNVAFVAPHVPLMDDPVWAEYCRDADIPLGPRTTPRKPNPIWGKRIDDQLEHSRSHRLTDEYLLNAARHYYGMVSLMDQRIGDIVKTVEERGWSDNTWFVYSADHGEMLGDHGFMAKMLFYRSSVQVPAIITPPEWNRSKAEDGLIESIDLTSTILDIAGAEPLEGAQGQTLLPLFAGADIGREVAHSAIQRGQRGEKDHHLAYYYVMAATQRYRFTMERSTRTPCELFDLADDPNEENNLVDDPAFKGICSDMMKDYVDPHLES